MSSQASCLFCKMVKGEIPVSRVFEDEKCFAIRDINPQAKTHILVIPKEHFSSLDELFAARGEGGLSEARGLAGHLLEKAAEIARSEKLLPDGFRVVVNTNGYAGQTVFHLHFHLLGGEPLKGGFGA